MSDSIRGVGCNEQEKIWTVVCDSNPQEGQMGLRTSLILRLYEWRELQREERSYERIFLWDLGRFASSGAICGEVV